MNAESAFELRDAILGFGAEHFIEGHYPAVSSRSEMDELFEKVRVAEEAVRQGRSILDPDEDTAYFLAAFSAGRSASS